jgi:hypothetical protein
MPAADHPATSSNSVYATGVTSSESKRLRAWPPTIAFAMSARFAARRLLLREHGLHAVRRRERAGTVADPHREWKVARPCS